MDSADSDDLTEVCARCAARLRAGARFCGRCGASAIGASDTDVVITGAISEENSASDVVRLVQVGIVVGTLFSLNLADGLIYRLNGKADLDLFGTITVAILALIAICFDRKSILAMLRPTCPSTRSTIEFIILSLCFFIFGYAYFHVARFLGITIFSQTTTYTAAGRSLDYILLMVAVLPSVAEETVFRGMVLDKLILVCGRRDALIIQAALFSVTHLFPAMFISHFTFGLILGILRLRTRSLYPAMVLHAAWNGYVVLSELSPDCCFGFTQ